MSQLARSPRQLGQLLQLHRRARGLSQSELARMAGLRQERISMIETGQPGTRLSAIYALLAALDLEMTLQPRTRSGAADVANLF